MNNNNLQNLYRQVIMDHYKNPRNKGLYENNEYVTIHLNNPSCGDEIDIQVKIENDTIVDIRHHGVGCSIWCSSASVMSETLKNKSVKEAKKITNNFFEMLKGNEYDDTDLDEAEIYIGVSQFPARIKCASLAWKALEKAVEDNE